MKKIILFSSLLVSAFSFAQYSTINSTSTPGLGIGVPTGTNFSDAAIHIKAANNGLYANGGGQQFLFAETAAPSAQGDYFRLMNASGSSALFSPMLSGFGNSHTGPSLQFLALANSSKDVGTSALMNFRAGLDFTPITSLENPNAGSNVINRPLFQWMNWQTPTMTMDAQGKLGLGTTTPTAALHLLTGSNAGMLPPVIKLDRNDATNQAGLLSVGISGNGFGTGLLGGGSAFFKLEDPYGNSANSDMGFSTNANAAQMVIKHNGFVGIGTETPTANFHSIGTARLQSLPTSTSNTNIITTDANGNLFSQAASSLVTSTAWDLNGNTGTNPLNDFVGTTDNNSLNFRTNNLNRMTLLSNGNLGLGTTTPTAALHLVTGVGTNQTPSVIKLDRNDATNQAGLLSVGISGNGFGTGLLGGGSAFFKLEDPYGNSANSDMGFSTNANAAQMVIKHNGFVGIGTETPTANLHSIGTARLESLPTSTSNTNIITTDANGNLATQTAASLLGTSGWALNGNAATATDFIGTTNTNPLNFVVNSVKSMSLDNGGNVSISTGGISTYQKLYVETNKQNDGIQVNQTGPTAATMDLNASGGGGKRWAFHSTGSGNVQGAGHLLFWDWTSNVERMRIDASGNVGIDSTNPQAKLDVQNGAVRIGNVCTPSGYKLFVEQGILTEKVKVAVSCSPAWADYVFAPNYNLKPLSEVEAYVKENKHLPNVPSASELVKEGLDLGKMQATQMGKIEELTLYMIEMKKEIETLKKENQSLKVLVSQPKN